MLVYFIFLCKWNGIIGWCKFGYFKVILYDNSFCLLLLVFYKLSFKGFLFLKWEVFFIIFFFLCRGEVVLFFWFSCVFGFDFKFIDLCGDGYVSGFFWRLVFGNGWMKFYWYEGLGYRLVGVGLGGVLFRINWKDVRRDLWGVG